MEDKPKLTPSLGKKKGVKIFSRFTFWRNGIGKGKRFFCKKCCNICFRVIKKEDVFECGECGSTDLIEKEK